jgi:Ulp1 family protease
VLDAQTLKPGIFLNDEIINFVWNQFADQHLSKGKDALRFGFFPSFFITQLMGEGGA